MTPEPYTALQVIMMPKDANPHPTPLPGQGDNVLYATVFGGVILGNIDLAGYIASRHYVARAGGRSDALLVTVAVNRVEFKKPVLVGDVVRFNARLVRFGRTSITVRIDVESERDGQ